MASVPAIPPPVHTDAEVLAWFEEVVLRGAEVWVAEENGAVVGLLVLDGSGSTSCTSTLITPAGESAHNS